MQWMPINMGLPSLRSGYLRVPASVVDGRDFPVTREEAENSFRAVLMHKITMNLSDRRRRSWVKEGPPRSS